MAVTTSGGPPPSIKGRQTYTAPMGALSPTLDATFFALWDPKRRGILQRLGRGPATLSQLAGPSGLTLNGIKKHVGILGIAGLVETEKVGRVRECRLGPATMSARRASGSRPIAVPGRPIGPLRALRGGREVSRELRYERLIQASPARVFDLFTSPAGQREFYGNDAPGWVVDSRCELRVGSAWEIAFGPSPGELYGHLHVFEAIERPRRLLLSTTETRLDGSRLASAPSSRSRPETGDSDDDGPVGLPVRRAARRARPRCAARVRPAGTGAVAQGRRPHGEVHPVMSFLTGSSPARTTSRRPPSPPRCQQHPTSSLPTPPPTNLGPLSHARPDQKPNFLSATSIHSTLYMSMSLDGFIDSDRGHPGMAIPEGAELKQWKLDRISKAGAHLMGRVTYQQMSSYWPQSDDP